MLPAQFSVLFLATMGSICLAEVHIRIPKSGDPSLIVETTFKVLTSCYGGDVSTVGLSGHSAGDLFQTLSSRLKLPVILIDNTTRIVKNIPLLRGRGHKLSVFVIAASTSTQLEETINEIKISMWWNHMASFVIVDWHSSNENEFSKAIKILSAAWKMDLLNVNFICIHGTKGQNYRVYNYNPYMNQAPHPWRLVNTYRVNNSHPWSLFVRNFEGGDEICENLNFVKTNDLNGYEIPCTANNLPRIWHTDYTKTGLDRFGEINGLFVQTIFRALNATIRLFDHNSAVPLGLYDIYGNDIAMDTVNGVSDILLIPRYPLIVCNFTTSNVVYESGLIVATQYSGEISQLTKILTVLDRWSRLGLCIVVASTVIFFKLFDRQTLMMSILNILRITTNSSIPKLPRNQASRVYLASVFLLAVIILAIYQGKFAALLTKPILRPNINGFEDLAVHGHTIHGHRTYAFFFNHSSFRNRFIEHKHYDCVDYVVSNSSAACVLDWHGALSKASELKLYVPTNLILKINIVYVIRDNWPLEKRYNDILATLMENGITRYILEKNIHRTLDVIKFNDKQKKNQKFDVIHLSELVFAFAILGIGLVCGTTIFVMEIIIIRVKFRIRNVDAQLRNRLHLM